MSATYMLCVCVHIYCIESSFFPPSSHMLIDYQTGFKWCGVNPQSASHKHINTHTHSCAHTVFRKDFLEMQL